MTESNQSGIEAICKKLFEKFHGILSWKWDDRLDCFLADFDVAKRGDILDILGKFLPIVWNSEDISSAPQIIQKLNKYLGGLRPTQLLFSSDPSHDSFVFCAWWPWGNGLTISIRVATISKNITQEEEDKLIEKLKLTVGV